MADSAKILAAAISRVRRITPEQGAEAALGALVILAEADVDAQTSEAPRGSNRGPDLRKFFSADDLKLKLDEGYAWCAAAVSYWVQTWLLECPAAKTLFGHIHPPRTARAFGLSEWAQTTKQCVEVIPVSRIRSGDTKPMAGDIAVFEFSHCGIVKTGTKGNFTCIEGNTDAAGSREGWQVARRGRVPSNLRHLLRFIPRPIPAA